MAYSNGIQIDDEISLKIIDAATEFVNNNGVEDLTVRKIINKLNVSNRVFYNRFKNIDELLEIIYKKSVAKMCDVLKSNDYYTGNDFVNHYCEIFTEVIKMTYIHKKQFSNFMFKHDSMSEEIRTWWVSRINRIMNTGIELGYIRNDINTEHISYCIWCFCRGFNTDAVNRKIPLEEAVTMYRETFSVFLKGLKPKE